MGKKIWLDDQHDIPGTQKTAPEGWIGVPDYEGVVEILEAPDFDGIDEMSFDFDLKPGDNNAKTGFDVMMLLANMTKAKRDQRYWPKSLKIHTTDHEWRMAMTRFAQEIRAELREMFSEATPAST